MLYDDLVQPGDYICHHGVKGQKWGIRRYQNPDGSLTAAGQKRYIKKLAKAVNNHDMFAIKKLNRSVREKVDNNEDIQAAIKEHRKLYSKIHDFNKEANHKLNLYLMKELYGFSEKKVNSMSPNERAQYTTTMDYLRAGFQNRDKFFNTKEITKAKEEYLRLGDYITNESNKIIRNELSNYLGDLGSKEVEGISTAVSVNLDTGKVFTPTYLDYVSAILTHK